MKGLFITFEGPEGSGKTSQARRLAERLRAGGVSVLQTREPGGTATGETIRQILQHGTSGESLCAVAETLLFSASRAQLVDSLIRPALERGTWVLCDRFTDSTTAYQGYAHGLDTDTLEALHLFATGGTMPDRTFLLDLPVAESLHRMRKRNHALDAAPDRFERESPEFHEKVRAGYLALAARYPLRIRVIDGRLPETEVAGRIWESMEDERR